MARTSDLIRTIGNAIVDALRPRRTRRPGTPTAPRRRRGSYPGDYPGRPRISYDPHPGTLADPGEVVWTWVPFEEDHSRGKDRPVLVIGRDGDWLLGLPLTSRDHDLDAAQEAQEGRFWVELGRGSWDSSGRVREVRVNRIVRVDPGAVRRVAGRLDKARFDRVAAAVRRYA